MKPLFVVCSVALLAACASNAPVVQEENTAVTNSSTQVTRAPICPKQEATVMVSSINCEDED
ncbi:hypothetical protein [Eikenella sp. NML03-A-027]|uniref:hypothetical protein n=1 Tax=Eikenella sp. NML03-A-027 TaxID=1795828 RepID=UPI000AC65B69|nr:hypothetical protein [Eikenella sp. NML03-A-027]